MNCVASESEIEYKKTAGWPFFGVPESSVIELELGLLLKYFSMSATSWFETLPFRVQKYAEVIII